MANALCLWLGVTTLLSLAGEDEFTVHMETAGW